MTKQKHKTAHDIMYIIQFIQEKNKLILHRRDDALSILDRKNHITSSANTNDSTEV